MKRDVILALFLLVLFSCTPKNAGQLTLVNSGISVLKIAVDGRTFTLRPSNHITKDFSAGPHRISIEGGETFDITVQKGLTTLFDSTGLSCFAVIDFSPRQRGEPPVVTERFQEQRIFTTQGTMVSILGNVLPKKLPEKDALRIHQVDCEMIGDDPVLVRELGNLP